MAKKYHKGFESIFGLDILARRVSRLIKQPVFILLTIWGHAAIFIGTLAFYYFERNINPHVFSLMDTFYWSVSLVTTVGFADSAPITLEGKVVGIIMMILGSIFLWSYTALFAGALVAPELREVEEEIRKIGEEVEGVDQKIQMDEITARELLEEIRRLNSNLINRGADTPPKA